MIAPPRLGQEQLKILLVDDNLFIRNIITQCLQHLGFRGMRGCSSGIEAIELLRPADPGPGSKQFNTQPFDLVISDLVMPHLNGMQLLQWIRTDSGSPNRFLPFIMISGAADEIQVHGARDTGANEFVAKPFSIGSILSRLQSVIDRPRQFAATNSYFGPCHRRISKDLPSDVPKDRRRVGESHANIVYSATDIKRQPEGSDVYLFKFPNFLKQKMGLENARVPFEMPSEILAEAEEALEREAEGFLEWAKDYLDELSEKVSQAFSDRDNRSEHLAELTASPMNYGVKAARLVIRSLPCLGKACTKPPPIPAEKTMPIWRFAAPISIPCGPSSVSESKAMVEL